MPEAMVIARDTRIAWAKPRSSHDRLIRRASIFLPLFIGALAAVLMIAPLMKRSEISFMLVKDKVEVASERMRVTSAEYRGEDSKGRPFRLSAGSAVQRTSKVPVVQMRDLAARITLDDGPATLRATAASYDMDKEFIVIPKGLVFEAANGFRLTTRAVGVDLKTRTLKSNTPVEGRMPLGTFTADSLHADLNAQTVALAGRARLHIVQGAGKRL